MIAEFTKLDQPNCQQMCLGFESRNEVGQSIGIMDLASTAIQMLHGYESYPEHKRLYGRIRRIEDNLRSNHSAFVDETTSFVDLTMMDALDTRIFRQALVIASKASFLKKAVCDTDSQALLNRSVVHSVRSGVRRAAITSRETANKALRLKNQHDTAGKISPLNLPVAEGVMSVAAARRNGVAVVRATTTSNSLAEYGSRTVRVGTSWDLVREPLLRPNGSPGLDYTFQSILSDVKYGVIIWRDAVTM